MISPSTLPMDCALWKFVALQDDVETGGKLISFQPKDEFEPAKQGAFKAVFAMIAKNREVCPAIDPTPDAIREMFGMKHKVTPTTQAVPIFRKVEKL